MMNFKGHKQYDFLEYMGFVRNGVEILEEVNKLEIVGDFLRNL